MHRGGRNPIRKERVAVVVLNWNQSIETIRCVEYLAVGSHPEVQLVVVDNGSDDCDYRRLRDALDERIVILRNDQNLGYSQGNNIGIQRALADGNSYVMILNNDTRFASKSLEILMDFLRGNAAAGVVCPKTYFMTSESPGIPTSKEKHRIQTVGGKLIPLLLIHMQLGQNETDVGQYNAPIEVDFVPGSCMLIRREVFDKIGLLPLPYFLQWEDIEFSHRARMAGWKCYTVPAATVYHRVSASMSKMESRSSYVERGVRNRIVYARRNLNGTMLAVSLVVITGILVPIHFTFHLFASRSLRKASAVIRGALEGLEGDIHSPRRFP